MRAFIAIDLPLELKEKIDETISELEDADFCDAKWVSEEQLHLTLKFLGEINGQQAAKVKSILEKVAKETKTFPLQLKGLGHFNQRVLWIGGDSKDCIRLAGIIDNNLGKLGFQKEERDFNIHLTLARIRYIKNNAKFTQLLKKYENLDVGKFKVDKIKLMGSILTKQGRIYRTIAEFNLF